MKPFSASLRAGFTAGCLVAIIGSAALSYLGFSRIAEMALLNAVRERVTALAENTAFVVAPLIVFESDAELRKAVNLLKADPDFLWAAVHNAEGQLLARAGTERAD